MIHDHEYNIGDELYFFDGRACTFKRVKIMNKHKDLDNYLFIGANGDEHWTHRYYLYDTKDFVKEEIERHIELLRDLMLKLESRE